MPYHFRLPIITDLTIEQQAALNESRAIAVSGGPGTGKSVVSLWRHIQNHDMGRRNSLLLTYTKSLESYLASSASSENETAGENVNRTYWWTFHLAKKGYDEIIIDEAQDVEEAKYNIIRSLTNMVSYSADDNQMIFPNKQTSELRLQEIFNKNQRYRLQENFRNTAQIVQFVRSMFRNRLITPGEDNGPMPTVILSDRTNQMQTVIIRDIIRNFKSDTHNIAVLVPLVRNVNSWNNTLTQNGINCSKFTGCDDEVGTIENVHITTYKSAKGLEFDTVIIPDFDEYKKHIEELHVVKENDYYVVFTRARRNLLLIDNSGHSNTNCNLDFLRLQIERNIVQVDNSYTKSVNHQEKSNETVIPSRSIIPPVPDFSIEEEDDLPF